MQKAGPQFDHGTTAPSRESARGLDWFTFFVADIQTGFGPFLSVFLTTQKWTQADIGLVLSIGSIAGLLGQIPGGWVVDAVKSKRRAAAFAVIGIGLSALLIAASPLFLTVVAGKLLHVGSSSVLGPAIAAITLGLVGYAAIGPRLGRNARFASLGNGIAAAVMGACGYFISPQSVFYVTAVLAIPTIWALLRIRDEEINPLTADGGFPRQDEPAPVTVAEVALRRPMVVLTMSVMLFHAANAAMLPLVGSAMAMRSSQWATALVAACIIVPQLIVAAISPKVGELAQDWGRKPLLLIGFGVLPIRGLLLAYTHEPFAIVAVQMLDGISASVLGVLVPLTIADATRGTGRFNLAQGIVGSAVGIGAAASTFVAGRLADIVGAPVTFLCLAIIAGCGVLLLLVAMPETKPRV
ncbi:MAG TPA: MFS transporter [Hyphomicrobiaceae bacterium]